MGAPGGAGRKGLGEGEQRMMCVVLAAPPEETAVETEAPTLGALPLEEALTAPSMPAAGAMGVAELHALALAAGGRLVPFLGGGWMMAFTGGARATDLAMQAAMCALAARRRGGEAPGVMAVVTGRAEVSGVVPVGALLDRGAALLRVRGAGRVRIDEVTAGLLDPRFEIHGEGAALVLQGERDIEEPTRTLLGRPTPCVGRDAHLAGLVATFEACVEGPQARAVLVSAAAGAGKSRLRHELLEQIRGRWAQVEVWSGQGDPLRAGSPFGLVAPLLRRMAGVMDGEPLGARRQKIRARVARHVPATEVPRVAAFIGELVGARFEDEDHLPLRAAREDAMIMGDQIRRAFVDLLDAECAARPVVLVLEDVHWGDRPSVGLVDAALRSLGGRALFVLALARPEVTEVFPGLWAERALTSVHLGPLSRRSCERVIRAALGEGVAEEVVARLVERSGGNAFCLEELIRAVAEGAGEALPDTVLSMVQARLGRLPPEERRVLRAASVFGQVFWRAGVAALLPREDAQKVPEWLEGLAAHELVARRPAARFPGQQELVFRHALVREAAYAMLTEEDRALGHRLAGAWLEKVGEVDALGLAEHFERGGSPGQAVRFYREAAEQALEGNDLGAALARAERGLLCLEGGRDAEGNGGREGTRGSVGGDEGGMGERKRERERERERERNEARGALMQIRAEAHRWRGENAESERWGLAAMGCVARGSATWFRAASEVAMSTGRLGHVEELLALLETLEGLAAQGPVAPAYLPASGRAVVSAILLGLRERAGVALGRMEATAQAAELGRDPVALGWLLRARAVQALYAGDAGAYLELTVGSAEAFGRAGDVRGACSQMVNIGFASSQLGRYAEAEAVLREAIATAERQGLHAIATGGRNNLGIALARLGRLDEALEVEQQAARALEAQGDRRLEGGSRTYLATILLLRRDLEGAEREARRAVEVLGGIKTSRAAALGILARVLIGRGDREGALMASEEAVALVESAGGGEEEAAVHLARAEALAAAGRMGEAREALRVGRDRLLVRADRITRGELSQSFLEGVPDHARLLSLAQAWLGAA
ncbi:Hypothetical protein CAP_7980 [Chondromyces apiculatus DSM 436]|uniref:Orc1-like AAA ATPase domain-containing protein n=1 Tax=Chondromyces apiculatus DSM 436 TaxID=1192034 RepID=A0A017SY89_9BACT|nr:Hypothetical protein CAP_7980 [Chondromyces apiculatus DSM 436]